MQKGLVVAFASLVLSAPAAICQQHRNIVNVPFQTVASGPMSVQFVDVPAQTRADTAQEAIARAVRAARSKREPGVLRYLQALRAMGVIDGRSSPGIPDIVALRRAGSVVLPSASPTRAPNELTFTFPAQGASGSWDARWEADLRAIIDVIYPELKAVYGEPAWSGTVKILNGDNMSPIISDPNALSGGIYNVSTGEITFQQNNSVQSAVLNLTQMLAIAFRGPKLLSYDAWERGMARAATLVAVRNALPGLLARPSQVFGGKLGDLSVADPLWQALDRYDWLNQPALANDRFFPVSKTNSDANTVGWPNMLVPRLQMSGSAWLKVLTEAPGFLREFNAAYYAAFDANPAIRNNVPQLVTLAAQAFATAGGATVEGLPFTDWFRRQYILDSSVSLGPKLYAQVSALRPDPGDDDFGLGVILMYYRTSLDASGNSDEVDLSAIAYPIYRDYTLDNRLFLGAQYEMVDIRSGLGTVAPTFYNTLGGDAALEGRMRITLDFPVGSESLRIEAAPRSSGKLDRPNNFWGVVVGADSGTLRLEGDGYATGDIPVRQGAFGASVDPVIFERPRRARLTFTDDIGRQTTRSVVTGYGEFVAVLEVSDAVDSRTQTLPAGISMVAFPIRPLQQKAADALRDPSTDLPLFNDTNLLMARWRQTLPGEDKYARYPDMEPIAPGKGYWIALSEPTAVRLTGRLASRDRDVTVGLLHGWNQIGNPYEVSIPASALLFQYRADNVPVDLATAIARGWVAAHTLPGVGQAAVWGYSPGTGYTPVQTLEPWTGYWIRVLVSEGVMITYPSPTTMQTTSRSAASRASGAARTSGWSVRFTLSDGQGRGATALIGQYASAGTGASRAELPPPFATDAPLIWTEDRASSGRYFADIRSPGDRQAWTLHVRTPLPDHTYTLRWTVPPELPRTLRLCLVDQATGQRTYMHASSAYSFNSGSSSGRSFLVLPEMRGADALRILNPRASVSRGAGVASVSYQLTASAAVTVEVRSAQGSVLRRLHSGRAAAAGEQSVLWDGRDSRGISVPAGAYNLVIHARSDDGQAARAIVPVVVTR